MTSIKAVYLDSTFKERGTVGVSNNQVWSGLSGALPWRCTLQLAKLQFANYVCQIAGLYLECLGNFLGFQWAWGHYFPCLLKGFQWQLRCSICLLYCSQLQDCIQIKHSLLSGFSLLHVSLTILCKMEVYEYQWYIINLAWIVRCKRQLEKLTDHIRM